MSLQTEIERIRNQISPPSWVLDKITMKEARELSAYLNGVAKDISQYVIKARIDEVVKMLEWAIANSGYCDEDYLNNRADELNAKEK